jgi:hypothetical protein
MATADLTFRLQRIYASIGAAQEFDLSKFPAKVVNTNRFFSIFQDFSGSMSEADMANAAQMIIQNIASLKNHLIGWAGKNGKDKERVTATVNGSLPLKIILDLWNTDKHGTKTRLNESHSGLLPVLTMISRVMMLTAPPGGGATIMLDRSGKMVVSGEGGASAIITGDVKDIDGNWVGHLYDLEQQAISAWEGLLAEYGVVAGDGRGS